MWQKKKKFNSIVGIRSHKPKRLGTTPPHSPEKCICLNLNQVMRRKGVSSKVHCQFLSTNSALNVLSNIFPKLITCSICIIVIAFVLLLSRCQGSKQNVMDLNNNHFVTLSQNSVLYITSLHPFVLSCSRVHGHVLQRAV